MNLPRSLLAASFAIALPGAALSDPVIAPYGSWSSPIAAADLANAAITMSDVRVFGDAVYWRESRPAEGGRQVLVRKDADGVRVLTPEGFSVRSRVHEYGGSSYWIVGDAVVFANFADQRLYLQRSDAPPQAITPQGYQWADCAIDAKRHALVCVREDHTAATKQAHGEERNEVVRLALPVASEAAPALSTGEVLVTGSDFVAYPRLSADGTRLAWIEWNHPSMPWETTTLKVATLDADGHPGAVQAVAGGDRAVLEPQWAADGTLYFIDEKSGWWNLYAWDGRESRPVAPMAREFGGPLWQIGMQTYALDGRGNALVRSGLRAIDQIGVIDLAKGGYRPLDLPHVAFGDIRLDAAGRVVTLATAVDEETALVAIDPTTAAVEVLHRTTKRTLPREFISIGQAIEFPTKAGPDGTPRTAHATYYPPLNPGFVGPAGEKPLLLVLVHGGPTSVSKPTFHLPRQFWTSRGFALVDVNYGGSTSFGRDYRKRLNRQWGIVDVEDVVAAVDFLVAQGKADPARVAIRGGSAGGFTTLAALAFTDRFRAGANYFGVADIAALAATSHKFERQYDVSLVGPPDEALYRSRSPLFHLDGFTEPLITFQGSEDRIVTPDQSRRIVEALDARGVMHAYFEFDGEQHGFRKAANIIRAQEAELYFYGRVFGFTPADAIEPVDLRHGRETP